jgi:bifunctional DNA-binding transcriptional regulator/antitoxin component of YhaV-PrlF toxin-antitoxin module
MTDSDLIREVDIDNPREQDHVIQMDTRGRVTIPSSVRHRYNIDPDDDGDWWVELTIHKLEKRQPAEADDDTGDT